jgi:hypothetical protein
VLTSSSDRAPPNAVDPSCGRSAGRRLGNVRRLPTFGSRHALRRSGREHDDDVEDVVDMQLRAPSTRFQAASTRPSDRQARQVSSVRGLAAKARISANDRELWRRCCQMQETRSQVLRPATMACRLDPNVGSSGRRTLLRLAALHGLSVRGAHDAARIHMHASPRSLLSRRARERSPCHAHTF